MFGATTSMQSCLVLPLVEGFNNSTQSIENFDETSDEFNSNEEFFAWRNCVRQVANMIVFKLADKFQRQH